LPFPLANAGIETSPTSTAPKVKFNSFIFILLWFCKYRV
jgi:hypothetical protein